MKLKLPLQFILSIFISFIIGYFTYSKIEDVSSKSTLKDFFKISDLPNSTNYDQKKIRYKTQIYIYESKDQLLTTKLDSECEKLDKKMGSINITHDKYTDYFGFEITTNKNRKILDSCFEDYVKIIETKYNDLVLKIEEDYSSNLNNPLVVKEYVEQNFGDGINLAQIIMLMVDQKLDSLETYNFIELLKKNSPIEIIRYEFTKVQFSKRNYFISIFIIVFGSIIIFSYHKIFFSSKIFKKLKKII